MELIQLLRDAAPVMLTGAGYTLVFAMAAMVGGLALGFPLALLRMAVHPWLRLPRHVSVSVSLQT